MNIPYHRALSCDFSKFKNSESKNEVHMLPNLYSILDIQFENRILEVEKT